MKWDDSPVQYWSESSWSSSGLPAQKSFTENLDLVNRQQRSACFHCVDERDFLHTGKNLIPPEVT